MRRWWRSLGHGAGYARCGEALSPESQAALDDVAATAVRLMRNQPPAGVLPCNLGCVDGDVCHYPKCEAG
jgi:hypothetical protein